MTKDNIFVFATYDIESKEKNLYQNAITTSESIEGVRAVVIGTDKGRCGTS
jgi:hypothetical protein